MSSVDQAADDIAKANARTLAPAAVLSQIAIMSVISIATILAFNFLRPKNKIIYEPKVKYHVGDKPPPRISDGLFGWLPPLIHTKEPELLDKVGLDAVTFLRFLRMMRWLFSSVTAVACGILIPVNVIYNIKNDVQGRTLLTALTIRDVSGGVLYAHVAVTYIITILICFFVYINWKAMVQLRAQWFRSPEFMESFYARTLAVTKVPRKYQSDDGVRMIFQELQIPYPTTSVHIGRKVGKLPELVDYHNATVRELEKVLVMYLKGGRIGKTRPKVRIGGVMGMGGTTHDAIDYYTAKLKRTEAAIEDYRQQIDTRKAENYGFASMAAVPYAHIVGKMLISKHPHGTTIELAPNPKDIIWSNMNMSDGARARKRTIGFFWLVFVCFMNTIPLLIISFLANLTVLTKFIHPLAGWQSASPATFDLASAVLPPAVAGIFGFFLPLIMRFLSQYMGITTHSKLDRVVVAHYFAFLIVSQLVIFTLIGVIFGAGRSIVEKIGKDSFKDILENLHTIPGDIQKTYIDQSSYWLTFFPMRGFLVLFDLAQIVNLVWLSFKTRVFGRTPRDIREWTQPPEFQYAVYYTNTLFMASVGLVFAPLAPLVSVAAAVVMWMSSWVYKYQLMFVFVSRVESGGRLWNVVVNRLLFSVVLMQALMVLTIGLQHDFKSLEWVSTLPPILIMIGFKIYLNRTFLQQFKFYNPTQHELDHAKVHSERGDVGRNRLEKRFGHPALTADLFTPMLHAKMVPLLSQVYSGKIGQSKTKLDEYNGQKMDAQIVEGGVKIAAIDQHDLERPDLYQRDRGEQDWDAKSIASTTVFGESTASLHAPKSRFQASQTSLPPVPNYDRYLAQGPGHINSPSEIELTRMDSANEPLLSPRSQFYHQQGQSQHSMAPSYQDPYSNGQMRTAPIHRQGTTDTFSPPQHYQPPYTQSPYGSPVQDMPPQRFHSPAPSRQGSTSEFNMAGRGAFRNY